MPQALLPPARSLFELPLHELQRVSVPMGAISPDGESEIKALITRVTRYDTWHRIDGIEWVWMTQQGALTKRLANTFYKMGCPLPDDVLMEIGNIANRHVDKQAEYVFDFDRDLAWHKGDFGDRLSCFMGQRRHTTLYTMRKNGFMAMRFFNPKDPTLGYARSFMYPKKDDGVMLLFNGYELETLTQARVLSLWAGVTYKRITGTNRGVNDGDFYLNGTGRQLYVLGEVEAVREFTKVFNDDRPYDFMLKTERDPDIIKCNGCGGYVSLREGRQLKARFFCTECVKGLTTCYLCREEHHRGDLLSVFATEDRKSHAIQVCNRCIGDVLYQCQGCGGHRFENEMHPTTIVGGHGGQSYCKKCVRDKYSICQCCGLIVNRGMKNCPACHELVKTMNIVTALRNITVLPSTAEGLVKAVRWMQDNRGANSEAIVTFTQQIIAEERKVPDGKPAGKRPTSQDRIKQLVAEREARREAPQPAGLAARW